MESLSAISNRKQSHIDLCLTQNVEGSGPNELERIFLKPCALPSGNIDDVFLGSQFLGRSFSLPILITAMTGGVPKGQGINEVFAVAAQSKNIPFGLGSQKMWLKEPSTKSLFDVRKVAPKVYLMGNLGAVSFNFGVTVDDCLRLVDAFELNALAIHFNALQESIQPEGERNFSNVLERVTELCKRSPVPIIAKEVGVGMDPKTCVSLVNSGVRAIDVGGKGGSSWAAIEGMRDTGKNGQGLRLGELFRNWGYSTVRSLSLCRPVIPQSIEMIATGGVRSGLDVAKLIGLGASMVGVGLPFFKAVASHELKSETDKQNALEDLCSEIDFFEKSLRIALFCSGCMNVSEVSQVLDFS